MKNKVTALALAAAAMSTLTGCTDSLFANIWTGFGLAIGGIPGNALGNIVAGFIPGLGG
jgi:hypothetical protein